MKFNDTKETVAERTSTTNHEGGEAFNPDTPELGLYKVVINNLLEDSFYESDEDSFDNVRNRFEDCAQDNPEFVLKLAYYAREEMYLRQIPQLLLVLAANNDDTKEFVRDYATGVMQRADEPLEVLAMQVKLFGKSIPNPLAKGIEDALHNFDEYQFAKYDSDSKEFSYRDLMNLVHPNPRDDEREELFERIVRGPLDKYPAVKPLKQHRTWENTLSDDEDDRTKEEKFRDRLDDMGLFAKIRNVRNMVEAGLDPEEILTEDDLEGVPHAKIYPFRYYQAYRALKPGSSTNRFGGLYQEEEEQEDLSTPHLDAWFEQAIDKSVSCVPEEFESTYVSADLSGSMEWETISERSTINLMEISALFGSICTKKGAAVSGFAESFTTFDFHSMTPALEMVERIKEAEVGGATNGHLAIDHLIENNIEYDNVVLFTDEQMWNSNRFRSGSVKDSWDTYTSQVNPGANLYVIDLASYGTMSMPEGYNNVFHISGWNENIIKHIKYASREDAAVQSVEEVGRP